MNYLLDSDIIIDYARGFQPTIDFLRKKLTRNDGVYISVITEAEVYAGKSFAKLDQFMAKEFPAQPISVDSTLARRAGKIKRDCQIGIIGIMDALIAATAIFNDCILITRNLKHFEKVKELKLEVIR